MQPWESACMHAVTDSRQLTPSPALTYPRIASVNIYHTLRHPYSFRLAPAAQSASSTSS